MVKILTNTPGSKTLLLVLGATFCSLKTGAAQETTNSFSTSTNTSGTLSINSGFNTSLGTSTINLSGSSTATIPNTSSSGTITINNGNFIIGPTNPGTTTSGTTTLGTGTIDFNTTTPSVSGTMTIGTGTGTIDLTTGVINISTTSPTITGSVQLSIATNYPAHMSAPQTLASQQTSQFNTITSMQAQRSVTGRAETASAFSGSDMLLGYTAQPGKGLADKAFSKLDQNETQPRAANATWRVWASQFGSSETVAPKASINSPASSSHNWGAMTGFEAILSPTLVVGVAVGGSLAPYSIASHAAYGQATGGQSSVYSSMTIDRFVVTGALGYGLQHTKASRVIALPSTTTEVLTYKNTTDVFSGSLEAGYRLPVGAYTVMPFATLEPAILRQHGATETSSAGSSSTFTVAYLSRETVTLPASLGLQIERAFPVTQNWTGQIELRSAWVHEFRPDRNSVFLYTSSPANNYIAHSTVPDDNLARISTTLSFTRNNDLTLFGRFDTDQSARLRSYAGQAGIKLAW